MNHPQMLSDPRAVIITDEIDDITVSVGLGLFKRLTLEDGHPVEVAALSTAQFLEVMVAESPPQGRCEDCGVLWAFDEHQLCTLDGAPDEQWQVTTPREVFAR